MINYSLSYRSRYEEVNGQRVKRAYAYARAKGAVKEFNLHGFLIDSLRQTGAQQQKDPCRLAAKAQRKGFVDVDNQLKIGESKTL